MKPVTTIFNFRALFVCLVGIALLSGCFRVEKETVSIAVPGMKGPECGNIIIARLGSVKGINVVQPDYDHGSVLVTFDSMNLALKNIEHLIAAAGFDANDLPADAEARSALPEACR